MRTTYSLEKKQGRYGWLFIIGPIVLIGLFAFYPMVKSLITSFQTGTGNNLQFAGLENYKRLLTDDVFRTSVYNTCLYFIFQVPFMLPLAMFIAVLLNDKKIKLKGFYRTAIFLPCITSLVAFSILFKNIFSIDGILNHLLLAMNIIQQPIQWLTDPFWAKVTIVIAITWRWTGYNMIFYLAGLQNIDPSIYEAAKIDGANGWHIFWRITMPLLKPIVLFTAILSTNGTLQMFDAVVNLTGGGPGNATLTISQYIYNLCFKYTPDFGYASTVAYVIVLMVGILSLIQFKVAGDKDV